PTSGRHAPRTTLLFALSEGAQLVGRRCKLGSVRLTLPNSHNGLTPRAKTLNAVVKPRSVSGRFRSAAELLLARRAGGAAEAPRVCRRLQLLRDWGHETGKEVLPRGAGAGGSAGVRARA